MTGIVSESFVEMTAAAVLSISPTCPAWPPLTRAQDGVISKKTEREMTRTSLSLGQPSDIVWLCHRFTAVEKSPFRRRTHLPPAAANDDDQKPGQHLSQNIQQELRHRHHLPSEGGFCPWPFCSHVARRFQARRNFSPPVPQEKTENAPKPGAFLLTENN